MKITLKTGAVVLIIVMNSATAFASLAESASIETSGNANEAVRSIDSVLGNIIPPEITGSLLKGYSHSSQRAENLLEGSSIGQDVSDRPVSGVGSERPARVAQLYGTPSAPDIFMFNNRQTGSADSAYQFSSTADLATRVSMNITNQITSAGNDTIGSDVPTVITGETNTTTPLPAAGLLLASGLIPLRFLRMHRRKSI